MEILPEQEEVVKYEGWLLMVVKRGMIGASIVPFGDLSTSVNAIAAIVAAFLFSNSIFYLNFVAALLQVRLVCGKSINRM